MCLKRIQRVELRKPETWEEEQENRRLEQEIQNEDAKLTINKDEELKNNEIGKEKVIQVDKSNQIKLDNKIKINENLYISLEKGLIFYDDGEKAELLKLISIEGNLENKNLDLKISTRYMGNTVEITIPRKEALQKKGIINLSAQGADINEINAKHHIASIQYQEKLIGKVNNVHSEIGLAEHNGKEVFKLYTAINEDSKYKGNLDIKPKGTLEGYLEDVRINVAPYASLSLALVIGASSAVVAKLNKLDVDINTLVAHIVAESSKGKSTATMLAISVWGNPKVGVGGLYNTWNATENALVTSLSGNNGVAYALDELSMTKVENLTSLIYNIVGGKDKARLTKNIEMRQSGTWITTIISNGEASILEKANSNTGLDIRVMELEGITWTQNAKHSEEVKKLTTRNYGVLGHSFAKKLLDFANDKLINLFENERQNFINKLKDRGITDNKIERASSKYAVLISTAKLINSGYKDYGINLDIDKITEILINTEIESINKRGLEKKAEDWLLQQVEANSSKFKSGNENNQNIDYWGTIKKLSDEEVEVAILRDKFNEIMKRGKFEDPKVVLKQLKEEGKLDYENGRLTRKRKINTITTEVYVIRLKQ